MKSAAQEITEPVTADALDSDDALVQAARNGDQAAFEQLYRRHAGWLLPLLWRLAGGDRARAEDWLQDAFVQAWKQLGKLRDPAAFGGWMRRLAVHTALSDKRRRNLMTASETADQAAPEPPWPAADVDLERAIAGLPVRARDVLVLFHLGGFSHQQIGTLMGIEVGTSKAQLHRARSLLKEVLQ